MVNSTKKPVIRDQPALECGWKPFKTNQV